MKKSKLVEVLNETSVVFQNFPLASFMISLNAVADCVANGVQGGVSLLDLDIACDQAETIYSLLTGMKNSANKAVYEGSNNGKPKN